MKFNGLSVLAVFAIVCLVVTGCASNLSALRKTAEQGNATAQFNLGYAYFEGEGVPQNYEEAVKWYRLSAEQGKAIAQFYMGLAYTLGQGVPQDYIEAEKWCRRAAEQGNAEAQCVMGFIYHYGEGVSQDDEEAVKWFRLAADQGVEEAQYRLGSAYYVGEGIPQDYTEAVKWWRLAAEQGHAEAQFGMACCYRSGNAVPQDFAQAYAWLTAAADQGSESIAKYRSMLIEEMTPAEIEEGQRLSREYAGRFSSQQEMDPEDATTQLCIGIVCARGEGVPQDFEKAVQWFRLAAEQGNAEAQYNMGLAYALGTGVLQDYTEAAKWFRLSADQGHAKAQWGLGGAYYLGQGVPQNYAEAIKWYRLAAEQGDVEAQIGMGAAYDQGEAVPQNYTEAAKWYRLAAEQGSAAAQFILGSLYYSGDGVPQDYAQAYAWLDISASQGYRESADSLLELIEKMTPVQLEEGERLSREFLCAGCKSPEEYMDQAQLNAWWSKEAKIEFAKKMKTGARSPAHDFVSQYDFANAALEDLPWNLHLLCLFGNEFWNYCEYVKETYPDWNYLEFNFPDPEPRSYERIDRTTCRLTDGIFTGELVVSNGTVSNVSVNCNDGFKIYKVGFADVNRDGFMDAVLWLVQHGSGSGIASGTYVLTRKQPGTKFSEVRRLK